MELNPPQKLIPEEKEVPLKWGELFLRQQEIEVLKSRIEVLEQENIRLKNDYYKLVIDNSMSYQCPVSNENRTFPFPHVSTLLKISPE